MSEATCEHGTVPQARPPQLGESAFRSTLPEEIDWRPFAAFPPSVRLAVVVGTPSERGPYTIRVKVPRGVKLMPHRHPEDRVYTVLSGVFYIGLGDQFDGDKLEAYPARRRYCAARQHVALPLGENQRIHYTDNGDWAAWNWLRRAERRSAEQNRLNFELVATAKSCQRCVLHSSPSVTPGEDLRRGFESGLTTDGPVNGTGP